MLLYCYSSNFDHASWAAIVYSVFRLEFLSPANAIYRFYCIFIVCNTSYYFFYMVSCRSFVFVSKTLGNNVDAQHLFYMKLLLFQIYVLISIKNIRCMHKTIKLPHRPYWIYENWGKKCILCTLYVCICMDILSVSVCFASLWSTRRTTLRFFSISCIFMYSETFFFLYGSFDDNMVYNTHTYTHNIVLLWYIRIGSCSIHCSFIRFLCILSEFIFFCHGLSQELFIQSSLFCSFKKKHTHTHMVYGCTSIA